MHAENKILISTESSYDIVIRSYQTNKIKAQRHICYFPITNEMTQRISCEFN